MFGGNRLVDTKYLKKFENICIFIKRKNGGVQSQVLIGHVVLITILELCFGDYLLDQNRR